jgi:hypothetical protein
MHGKAWILSFVWAMEPPFPMYNVTVGTEKKSIAAMASR